MHERFRDLLSGEVDSVARAAEKRGAAAARTRGRQWRAHRRLATSALSLVLVAGLSAGGFAAVSLGHGGTPAAHGGAPISAPSVARSSGPAYPTASQSVGASKSATSSPHSVASAANPATYVPGAWLSASELPYAQPAGVAWGAETNLVGAKLEGSVYLLAPSDLTAAYQCTMYNSGSALADALSRGLTGAQTDAFRSTEVDRAVTHGTSPSDATEHAFFYTNAAAARAAFDALPQAYATCKTEITGTDPTTGATVVGQLRQTLDTPTVRCWSLHAEGEAATEHNCSMQSGTVIVSIELWVNQAPSLSTLDFGPSDTIEAAQLQQALLAYTGG